MVKKCWAEGIGTCEGPLTAEHIISESQLSDVISVRGFRWCKNEFRSIGKSSAVAKILCRRHNNQLSDADNEATRFQKFLPKFFPERRGTGIVGERFFELDGVLFSRWLCKTYCNSMAAEAKVPNSDLARYAFGYDTVRPLFFYVSAVIGKPAQAEDRGFHFREYLHPDGHLLVCFNFWGIRWIVSNVRINNSVAPVLHDMGLPIHRGPLMDRPTCITHLSNHRFTPRKLGELRINWG